MGSVNPPKKRGYGDKTRIDMNQAYQVAYWKERFGVSQEQLSEGTRGGCIGQEGGSVPEIKGCTLKPAEL